MSSVCLNRSALDMVMRIIQEVQMEHDKFHHSKEKWWMVLSLATILATTFHTCADDFLIVVILIRLWSCYARSSLVVGTSSDATSEILNSLTWQWGVSSKMKKSYKWHSKRRLGFWSVVSSINWRFEPKLRRTNH